MNFPKHNKLASRLLSLLLVLSLASCSVNPVTGKKELAWMDENWEVATGKRYYGLQQQAGGGSYTLDPDLTLYVSSVGRKITPFSSRSHLPYEFVVLNDSTPNAWALPGGKIAINRGLLTVLEDEAELAAVLAHEIVHADARHSAQAQEVGTLIAVGQTTAAVLAAKSDKNGPLLQQGIALSGLYGQTRYSRSRESEADFYGMEYMAKAGYDPRAAISLQEKFLALSKGRQSNLFSELFASHPPSAARVKANRETAAKMLPMGTRNKARYQQEIAKLKQRQPAYDLADDAIKAIGEKNYREALSLSEKALKLEPNESRFHEVKGIALHGLNRAQDALKALDQSVQLDPKFYRPLLRRGLLRYELKSMSAARSDLEASIALAPSPAAYEKLGSIAERNQQCRKAIDYYNKAFQAGAQSDETLQNRIAALKLTCR
jgi:predicted Zn-dependent protease